MSGDLRPSGRRLRRARARGDVAVSTDLLLTAGLAGGLAGLVMFGRPTLHDLASSLSSSLVAATSTSSPSAEQALITALSDLAHSALPPAGAAVVGVVVVGLVQTGGLFASKAVTLNGPRWENPFNINMMCEGLRRLAAGILLLMAGLAWVYAGRLDLAEAGTLGPAAQAAFGISLILELLVFILFLSTLPVAIDMWSQRRGLLRRLAQTPWEQRAEKRAAEGDPQVKQAMRQRAQSADGANDPGTWSDVRGVLLGPGPLAVAVKYRDDQDLLPRVHRVGRAGGAKLLTDAARRHDVPLTRDPLLARGLSRIPPGGVVPRALRPRLATVFKAAAARTGR